MSNSDQPNLRTDYLHGTAALTSFYHYLIQQPDFAQIIQDKSQESIDRELLATVIQEQYTGLDLPPKAAENLQLLADPHTYTVTTGHQLVLFGGPMFTFYKVLHTIRLAEHLTATLPDHTVVPIFWIHTEDHDFEEINHYYTAFDEKHTYPAPFAGPVGEHLLTEAITPLIPQQYNGALAEAFQPGRSLADAYRRFMHELFGEYGLLMLDASDARLKAEFSEIFTQEIFQQESHKQVEAFSAQLVGKGYHQQINAREINVFYMDTTTRARLVQVGEDSFQVYGTDRTFTAQEMRQLIQEHPEKLSPNVVLRPLYQERILPNLAYMGGWGEISYWLQLKGVFEHFGVNYPLLLPRFSATLLKEDFVKEWEALGLPLSEVSTPLLILNQRILSTVWQDGELAQLEQELEQVFDKIAHYLSSLSQTLPRSAVGQKVKNGHFFRNLEKKVHRVVKHNEPIFRQVQELKEQVSPRNLVQERVLNLAAFPQYDPHVLIQHLYPHCQPLDLTHQYIILP